MIFLPAKISPKKTGESKFGVESKPHPPEEQWVQFKLIKKDRIALCITFK